MANQSKMEGKFSEFLAASKAADQSESSASTTTSADVNSTEDSIDISTEVIKHHVLKTVTFKAPEEVRLHWVVEAKKRRTTVSRICRDSLVEQLGLPEGWDQSDLS